MHKPLPTNFVLLVNDDSHFLLDLLTLLHPILRWSNSREQPNEKYTNCNNYTVALFIEGNYLTYLETPSKQERYNPTAPRFTGPELLRKFVFGEGQDQKFLTRNNLIALGPLTEDRWNFDLIECDNSPYWSCNPNIDDSWESDYVGNTPKKLLYALPYQHPLILNHIKRVLGIDPTLKPEIIPPRKPVLDDIFQI